MNLPNYLSVIRILIVPLFFSCLVYYDPEHLQFRFWAFGLFALATLTDAVDGIIARHFNLKSELGSFLDPLADKLLLLSGFFGILLSKGFSLYPPVWITILVVFRDLLIVCGLVIIFVSKNKLEIKPALLGKVTTAFQMATIIAVLVEWRLAPWVWHATAVLTVLSGIQYVLRGIRILNQP